MPPPLKTAQLSSIVRWLLLLVSCLVALGVGLAQLQHIPHYDEFYHVLPAISWSQEGSLRLLDGEYTRASLFTILVSYSFDLLGVSFEAGRWISVISGIGLAALLFLWISRRAGSSAALLAILLLAISPAFVFSVGQIRFYVLHALVVATAATLAFAATDRTVPANQRIVKALFCLFFLALGMHLQPSTLVAAGAIFLWVLIEYRHLYFDRHTKTKFVLIFACLIALAAAFALGILGYIWDHLMIGTLWAAETATRPHFYIQHFSNAYGFLFGLIPLLLWISYRSVNQRLLMFCTLMAIAPLIVHSLAAQKAGRYILYVMPWLAALAGISLSAALKQLWSQRHLTVSATIPLSLFLILPVAMDPTLRNTIKAALVPDQNSTAVADWGSMVEQFKSFSAERTVVVSEGIKAAYYLGDYDYDLNLSVSQETLNPGEFGLDFRTGRPGIGTLEEVSLVLDCHTSGVFLLDAKRWRSFHGINNEVADLIEEKTQRSEAGKKAGFKVFTWENPTPKSEACHHIQAQLTRQVE